MTVDGNETLTALDAFASRQHADELDAVAVVVRPKRLRIRRLEPTWQESVDVFFEDD